MSDPAGVPGSHFTGTLVAVAFFWRNRMKPRQGTPRNMDEYIDRFPKDVQVILRKVRTTIRNAAPGAEEKISYRMPTFALNGNLVHFAAWKEHIGFYPAPTGIEEFKTELSAYKGARGSVQFPLDKPIPYDLIGRIVKYRVRENQNRAHGVGPKQTT
jgi:uncharacterized protein YdhG (YjbR/CyaY superfamily)